jgi:hypothetical protein
VNFENEYGEFFQKVYYSSKFNVVWEKVNLNKLVLCLLACVLLISGLTAILNVQPVQASGIIYIKSDGTIDPPSAPIQKDGTTYTFTEDIVNQSIVIQMGGIALDGAGHKIENVGSGSGITIQVSLVEIRNLQIAGFYYGINTLGDGDQ